MKNEEEEEEEGGVYDREGIGGVIAKLKCASMWGRQVMSCGNGSSYSLLAARRITSCVPK